MSISIHTYILVGADVDEVETQNVTTKYDVDTGKPYDKITATTEWKLGNKQMDYIDAFEDICEHPLRFMYGPHDSGVVGISLDSLEPNEQSNIVLEELPHIQEKAKLALKEQFDYDGNINLIVVSSVG